MRLFTPLLRRAAPRTKAARARFIALLVAGAAGFAPPASAHHSYAVFDASRTVTLDGAVVEFEWTNPHSWLRVMAPQPSGPAVEWNLEAGGPALLARRGIHPKDLKPGDKVTVVLNPRRDGAFGGGLLSVTLADGRMLMFR